jgi:hypothetical protein
LIGLTSFRSKEVPALPGYEPKRAALVINKIDQILEWEERHERARDTHFTDLGKYLCEIRAGQYWRYENHRSFDDFLTSRFPESRRKAYYLMSIHEGLPRAIRKDLRHIGWSKAVELVKVARSDRENFDCATWLHKARSSSKEQFKQAVEEHLTGKESEPYDLLYFKLYRSQIPIVEQALETAALMLGSDRSRGYCLEMICADFLAGAHFSESGDPQILVEAITRVAAMLPRDSRSVLMNRMNSLCEEEG